MIMITITSFSPHHLPWYRQFCCRNYSMCMVYYAICQSSVPSNRHSAKTGKGPNAGMANARNAEQTWRYHNPKPVRHLAFQAFTTFGIPVFGTLVRSHQDAATVGHAKTHSRKLKTCTTAIKLQVAEIKGRCACIVRDKAMHTMRTTLTAVIKSQSGMLNNPRCQVKHTTHTAWVLLPFLDSTYCTVYLRERLLNLNIAQILGMERLACILKRDAKFLGLGVQKMGYSTFWGKVLLKSCVAILKSSLPYLPSALIYLLPILSYLSSALF